MAPATLSQGSSGLFSSTFSPTKVSSVPSPSEGPVCAYLPPLSDSGSSLRSEARAGISWRHGCCSKEMESLRQGSRRIFGMKKRLEALQPLHAANYEASEDSELTFLERLVKAWSILFPPRLKDLSNAEIARERLRLVLYSDRGEVSPEIRRKLRDNILKAISTYVEIAAEEEIGFSVTTDPDIGTVYSVTVPVRRVKPEYQEHWGEGGFRDRLWTEQGAVEDDEDMGFLKARFRLETQILRDDSDGSPGGASDKR